MTVLSAQTIFNIKDNSINDVSSVTDLPLVRQFFMFKAQKGRPGIHWFQDVAGLYKEFGDETFNENNSTYYSNSAMFAETACGNAAIAAMRLIPDDATKASAVVYLTLSAGDIQQYQKDPTTGQRLLDVDGDWIEETGVTLAGYNAVWSIEALGAGVELDELEVTTTEVDTVTYTKYPMFAFTYSSPCAHGNRMAFEFFYDADENSLTDLESCKSVKMTLRMKELEYGSTAATFVRTYYSKIASSFSLLSGMVNSKTNISVSMTNTIERVFNDSAPFPFDYYVYEGNIKTIETTLRAVLTEDEETELGDLVDDTTAQIINIFSGVNPATGIEYDAMAFDTSAIGKNNLYYLTGGSDGTITLANEQTMVQAVLDLTAIPELEDKNKQPINMIVDPGWSLATKYELVNFLERRSDVIIGLTTYQQDADVLTEDEDYTLGQALINRCLLTQESTVYGTEACRATVMLQSGIRNLSVKNTIVPATYWLCKSLSEKYGGTFISEPLVTYPNSIVDDFKIKSINWVPVKVDFKNKLYGAGLNYMQWYDQYQLHYPILRSVYPEESSKLVDFEFVVACVIIQQICNDVGKDYFGSELPADVRHFAIKKEIDKRIAKAINNKYPIETEVYQNDDDKALGYIDRVAITVSAGNALVLLNVDLYVEDPE